MRQRFAAVLLSIFSTGMAFASPVADRRPIQHPSIVRIQITNAQNETVLDALGSLSSGLPFAAQVSNDHAYVASATQTAAGKVLLAQKTFKTGWFVKVNLDKATCVTGDDQSCRIAHIQIQNDKLVAMRHASFGGVGRPSGSIDLPDVDNLSSTTTAQFSSAKDSVEIKLWDGLTAKVTLRQQP